MGIYELLVMNDNLRDMIVAERLDRRLPQRLPQVRHADPPRGRACDAIHNGITTIEEVVRETMLEDEG